MTNDETATRFLNVDLDILSKVSLEPLVAALGEKVFVHYVGPEGRTFGAHVSRSSYGQTADKLTRELCALVQRLPRGPRRLWNNAVSREFNVGIQAGLTPHSHEVRISEKTVALVARLGGAVVLTTYAPCRTAARSRRRRTRASVPPNNEMHLTRSAKVRRRGPRR